MSENVAITFDDVEEFFSKPFPLTRPLPPSYPEDSTQAGLCRIRDLLDLQETANNVICAASREQVDEWMSWLQSVVTNIAGRQFQDLFPPEAIAQYRDCHGKRLPGLHPIMQPAEGEYSATWESLMEDLRDRRRLADIEPTVFWQYISPDDPDLTLEQQVDYLRFQAIPRAAYGLASAFASETLILQSKNYDLKAQLAELKRENRKLQEENSQLK